MAGQGGRWVDLQTAAAILDTSTEAVRKRASRGTLESEKREDGRVYVRVDDDRTEGGREAQGETSRTELVEELRDRINSLERRLDEERDANKEMRRLLAGLIERVPQLEAPPKEQPGVPQEPKGQAQEPQPEPGGVEDQEAVRRPWWRRWFGE